MRFSRGHIRINSVCGIIGILEISFVRPEEYCLCSRKCCLSENELLGLCGFLIYIGCLNLLLMKQCRVGFGWAAFFSFYFVSSYFSSASGRKIPQKHFSKKLFTGPRSVHAKSPLHFSVLFLPPSVPRWSHAGPTPVPRRSRARRSKTTSQILHTKSFDHGSHPQIQCCRSNIGGKLACQLPTPITRQ